MESIFAAQQRPSEREAADRALCAQVSQVAAFMADLTGRSLAELLGGRQ